MRNTSARESLRAPSAFTTPLSVLLPPDLSSGRQNGEHVLFHGQCDVHDAARHERERSAGNNAGAREDASNDVYTIASTDIGERHFQPIRLLAVYRANSDGVATGAHRVHGGLVN